MFLPFQLQLDVPELVVSHRILPAMIAVSGKWDFKILDVNNFI